MSDNQTSNNRYGTYRANRLNKEIEDYINRENITDGEFSKRVGYGRSTVTNWKNGIHRPSEKALDNLSKVLR